jgi:hypothetical protein
MSVTDVTADLLDHGKPKLGFSRARFAAVTSVTNWERVVKRMVGMSNKERTER